MDPLTRLLLPVLCLATSGFLPGMVSGQCSIPDNYSNRATTMVGSVLVTLATDHESYVTGTPVHFWLSFENTGITQVTIPNPSMITPMQGIVVLPARCDSLDQEGCPDSWVYEYPFGIFFFGGPLVLNPGQCSFIEPIWDGLPPPTHSITPGLHSVFGGMNTSRGEFHFPVGGVRLNIQIQGSATVPVLPASWGLIKSRYQ